MLSGPSLSGVQVFALHMLDLSEQRESLMGDFDAIKRALLTANPKLMGVLFPDLASVRDRQGDAGEEIPPEDTAPPPPDEVEEMERWLASATSAAGVSMSGAEIYGPDEGWQ